MTFLAIAFFLYFLPAILASTRRHPSAAAIWVVNFLFGWTILGWIACLLWASTAPPLPTLVLAALPVYAASPAWATHPTPGLLLCGACQRPLPPNARFCSMCGSSDRFVAAEPTPSTALRYTPPLS